MQALSKSFLHHEEVYVPITSVAQGRGAISPSLQTRALGSELWMACGHIPTLSYHSLMNGTTGLKPVAMFPGLRTTPGAELGLHPF